MFRSRLLARLLLLTAATIAVTAVVILLISSWKLGDAGSREARSILEQRSNAIHGQIEKILGAPPAEQLQELALLSRASGLGITVFDAGARVIHDARMPTIAGEDQSDRPEMRELMRGDAVFLIRFSPYIGTDTAFWGEKMQIGGITYLVRYSLSLRILDEIVRTLRGATLFGAALSALILLVPVVLIAVALRSPLMRMRDKVRDAAAGEFGEPMKIRATNEIGDLAHAMDEMCANLTRSVALSDLENRNLSAILAAMVEGVIAIDADERVIYLNNPAATILDITPERGIGSHLWEITRKQPLSGAILEALNTDSSDTREIRLVGDRGDRFIKIYSTPLIGAGGSAAGAVVVLQDVTTLRKLADLRRDLVTNVSHQFKTPLTAIKGMAETMLDAPDMEPDQRARFLSRILDQSERLTSIAADLLELTRVETREDEQPHITQDIRPIVADVFNALAERGRTQGLEMVLAEDDVQVPVTCDRQAITQIAENLIDNAIKYTPGGGRVTVRVARDGAHALIEVRDTGVGIDLQEQEHIFERFYRTEHAKSLPIKGTGLGLSIIDSIVRSYDGTIAVESALGRGSCFSIRLPLQRKISHTS